LVLLYYFIAGLLYRSLNAIVAQYKNCPLGVNIKIELKK